MKLKPLHNQVILKVSTEPEKTSGGLVIPENASKERPEKAEVIAVGPGKLLDSGQRAPMGVEIGQTVIFKKYSPDEIKVEDQEFYVISEDDIIAIVD